MAYRHKTDRAADDAVAHGQAHTRAELEGTHRDAVMGSPLSPDVSYYLRVHAYDAYERVDFLPTAREAADGMEPKTSDRPVKLHIRVVEGHLGGHAFSGQMHRYLARVKPLAIQEEEREDYEWWTTQYGVERVRQAFIARYGETRGLTASKAVLEYRFSEHTVDELLTIAAQYGRSSGWLDRMDHLADMFAATRKDSRPKKSA